MADGTQSCPLSIILSYVLNVFNLIGMSTIPEVLVAHHCGIRVFAFSLITNECILDDDSDEIVNHENVVGMANQRQDQLRTFVSKMIVAIDQTRGSPPA